MPELAALVMGPGTAPTIRFDRIHSWDGDVALDQSDCLNRANSGEKRTG